MIGSWVADGLMNSFQVELQWTPPVVAILNLSVSDLNAKVELSASIGSAAVAVAPSPCQSIKPNGPQPCLSLTNYVSISS